MQIMLLKNHDDLLVFSRILALWKFSYTTTFIQIEGKKKSNTGVPYTSLTSQDPLTFIQLEILKPVSYPDDLYACHSGKPMYS